MFYKIHYFCGHLPRNIQMKISNFQGKASYLEPFLYSIKRVTHSFWNVPAANPVHREITGSLTAMTKTIYFLSQNINPSSVIPSVNSTLMGPFYNHMPAWALLPTHYSQILQRSVTTHGEVCSLGISRELSTRSSTKKTSLTSGNWIGN